MGLMGSSVARALVPDLDVHCLDPDRQSLTLAENLGATPVATVTDMLDCDLILLAAPTSANTMLLADLMSSGHHVPTADLGSVKRPILAQWRKDPAYPFVATHPMAGSELSGAAAGSADLFRDCAWPIVVEPETDPAVLRSVIELIITLGGRAIPMSAAGHDRAIALASHLPHLLAGALGRIVADSGNADLVVTVAGGSFRDTTRVSASPPERTAEFITANTPDAAVAVRAAAAELAEVADLLDQPDPAAVARWLGAARRVRDAYVTRGSDARRERRVGDPATVRDVLVEVRDSGAVVVGIDDSGVEFAAT